MDKLNKRRKGTEKKGRGVGGRGKGSSRSAEENGSLGNGWK